MPPFSSGFAGSLGQGVVTGAVESQEKARKEAQDRETKALHTFTQLTGQGWMPLDKDKGSPSGEAMFFPSLGQMLVPPVVDKTTEAMMKLTNTMAEVRNKETEYQTLLRRSEMLEEQGIRQERHDSVELAKAQVGLKKTQAELEKVIKGEGKQINYDIFYDAYNTPWPVHIQQDGSIQVGKDVVVKSLDDFLPPGKKRAGLSKTKQEVEIEMPHPTEKGKLLRTKKSAGEAQDLIELGKAIAGHSVQEKEDKPADLTEAKAKLFNFDGGARGSQKFRMLNPPPTEQSNFAALAEKEGMVVHRKFLPGVPGRVYGNKYEPITLLIAKKKGEPITYEDLVSELMTYYPGFDTMDKASERLKASVGIK